MGPLPKGEGLDARAWASARAAGALLGVVGTVAGAPPENPSDGGGEPRRVWGGVALRPHPGCPTGTLRVHPSTPTPAAQISLPPKEFKRFFSYTSNRHNHVWNRDTFFPPPRGWPGRAPRLARGARPAHTGGCWGAPSGPGGAHPIHPVERLGRAPATPRAAGAHPRGQLGRTPQKHEQRPGTQGRGTSPRITWTPKGLHHRSKATSQPRYTTGRQARPGFRPRDRCLSAHHARHMGTIPGRASPNCPHMHSQRPRTQGPGTSPRITWTPKGLHHRSKATSQPRHTTG